MMTSSNGNISIVTGHLRWLTINRKHSPEKGSAKNVNDSNTHENSWELVGHLMAPSSVGNVIRNHDNRWNVKEHIHNFVVRDVPADVPAEHGGTKQLPEPL